MPVAPNSAYVSLETVMNLIRAVANDMIYSSAGEILTDQANITLPLLNDALEWFQNEMNNHGVDSFTKQTILTPLTPVTGPNSTDPATQVWIDDTGYFDSVEYHIAPQLQLPPDLLVPLNLWERQTGSQEDFLLMVETPDGLPSVVPNDRFGVWQWLTDRLLMPGAVQSNDLRLRYTGSLAMFVSTEDILYFRGATGSLAYKMVSTYMTSKNPEASQNAMAEAEKRMNQLVTRSARMQQRMPVIRQSYGNTRGNRSFFPPRNSS